MIILTLVSLPHPRPHVRLHVLAVRGEHGAKGLVNAGQVYLGLEMSSRTINLQGAEASRSLPSLRP